MKKFLDKLKNALPFGKDKVSDKEIEDSIDEYEDNFLEGDSTDPDLAIPIAATQNNNDSTQPDLDLSDKTIPGVIDEATLAQLESESEEFQHSATETEILPSEEVEEEKVEVSSQEITGTQEIDETLEAGPIEEVLEDDGIEADPHGFNDKTHWRDRGTATEIPNLPNEEIDEDILDTRNSAKVSVMSKIKNLFNRKKKKETVYYDEDLDFEDIVPSKKKKKKSKSKSSSSGSLSFLSFFQWLFSVESRPRVHRYFLIILFFIFFFSIGKIVGLFISGNKVPSIAEPAPVDLKGSSITSQQLTAFSVQDIFDAKEVVSEVVEKTPNQINLEEICLKADSKTNFPYYLLNTIVLQNSKKSLAAVKVRSNPTLLELREGEEIEGKARIDRIGRLRAIIKNFNTGACEYIENSDAKAPPKNINVLSKTDSATKKQQLEDIQGIQNDGNSTIIERDFLNKQLSNISGILSQALAIPVNNPDGTVAFRITEIEPGSIYSYLNIQNGDMITEINGKKIATQNEVLNLFGKLKTIKKLQLTVKRSGAPTQLDYTFK